MRQALLPCGVRLSSSLARALAVGWLAIGGMKSSGMGLLVENDAIHSLERKLLGVRLAWFDAKADAEETRRHPYD